MKPAFLALSLALAAAAPAFGADQEETFTTPEAGAEYLDGQKLSKLMEKSDPKAANNIGWLFARGEGGVKQDYKEALQWWKFSASRGFTPAMNNLGLLYAHGHGVQQNYEDAFKWWMRAAERGDAWAMNAVGDLYENGQGVPQSFELALTWYKEAAREGDPLGLWNVGNLHEKGLGTAQDAAAAADWFRQSAEKGYAPAMHRLGQLYAQGKGVAADPVEAYALMTLAGRRFGPEDAADAGDNTAALGRLTATLTAGQRSAGEARLAELDRTYRAPEKPRAKDGSAI